MLSECLGHFQSRGDVSYTIKFIDGVVLDPFPIFCFDFSGRQTAVFEGIETLPSGGRVLRDRQLILINPTLKKETTAMC